MVQCKPGVAAQCPPDANPGVDVASPEGEKRLAELARALGHPARVRIVRTLLTREECIAGELADEVQLAASTVSQHLTALKKVGLIKGEVDGPRRCYCVDRSMLELFVSLVSTLEPDCARDLKKGA